MNATHFFEKVRGDRSLPPSSESFWTAIFAMFLLHLAKAESEAQLDCWEPLAAERAPWYRRKAKTAALDVRGLTFDGLVVEPRTVMDVWPEAAIDIGLGGISPDVVLRLGEKDSRRYILVENKITTGSSLNGNQLSAYPELVRRLRTHGIDARLFVLHPAGCSQTLYAATKALNHQLQELFGVILWEDVFRRMHRSRFSIAGFDPDVLQTYTTDASTDCDAW